MLADITKRHTDATVAEDIPSRAIVGMRAVCRCLRTGPSVPQWPLPATTELPDSSARHETGDRHSNNEAVNACASRVFAFRGCAGNVSNQG